MNQINVRPRVVAFVSWNVLTQVQAFLDGTELLHSAEEQVRRELEKVLALNSEWNFQEGATVIYGESTQEILEVVGTHKAPDLILITPETVGKGVCQEVAAQFQRVLWTSDRDQPLRTFS